MNKLITDANVFIRLLVGDVFSEVRKSKALIAKAKSGKVLLVVPQIIVFEVNYALIKFYGFKKDRVITALESILAPQYFEIETREIFVEAIKIYKVENMDFTDCFLAAKSNLERTDVFSFDKKLMKYLHK